MHRHQVHLCRSAWPARERDNAGMQRVTPNRIRRWLNDVLASKQWSAREWAIRAGVSPTTVTRALAPDYEFVTSSRTLTKLADAAGVAPLEATSSNDGYVPIVGMVGADPEGRVLFATGQGTGDLAPIPPGGTDKAVALEVRGGSMPTLADDGALVYYEERHKTPTRDMFNRVVVVETETDEVLIKRLLRGSEPDTYDLESINGPIRRDVRIRWAAHFTAIIPPPVSQRVIIRAGTAAA
jgi:hypothetical protein